MIFQLTAPHVRIAVNLFDIDRDGVVTTERAWTTTADRLPAAGRGHLLGPRRRRLRLRRRARRGRRRPDQLRRGHGPMTAGLLEGAATRARAQYPIPYAGTKAYDADSDGDGILDGADDQDFDDVPNIMELSRNMAGNAPHPGGLRRTRGTSTTRRSRGRPTSTRSTRACRTSCSRTCQRHPDDRRGLRAVHPELRAVRPQLARSVSCSEGPLACGPSVVLGRRGGALELDVELRAARERLQHDAVALGQLEQRGELLVVGVGVELEAQADVAEADRRGLVDAQRAAEVEVALGVDLALVDRDRRGSC